MLTANEIIEIQCALDAMERRLSAQICGAINRKFGHDLPELESNCDNPRRSTPSLFDDSNIGFIRREAKELFAVEAAREAIMQGTYGSCAQCVTKRLSSSACGRDPLRRIACPARSN